ncbi:MAG: ATP-binding protein [Chloroflexia bacterium]
MLVVLLVISVLGYSIQTLVENRLRDNLDAGLNSTADALTSLLLTDPETDVTQQVLRLTTGINQTSQEAETTYVRLYDWQGLPLPLGDVQPPLPEAEPGQLQGLLGPKLETVLLPDSTQLRLLTSPVMYGGDVFAYVQVVRDLGPINRIASQLQTTLVVGALLAALIAGVLAYILAFQALKPFSEIVEDTADVGVEQLSHRLPHNYGVNEVSSLAYSFNSLLDRLEKAFELQRSFVADASHEIRTPLTSIRGNLEVLLLDPDLSPQNREAIRHVESESARLSRLVTNLLLMARADAGQSLPAHRPVDLHALVLETIHQARGLSRNVSVRLVREDQAIVAGDADQIKQVLFNLLDNAIKFTPDGGRVSVSVYPEADCGKLEVRDDGAGIPPADVQRIFDRFYQVERGRRGASGSGLGLSIAAWVVRAHNGRIDVESKLGEGSVFTVSLPLYEPRTEAKLAAGPVRAALHE